MKSDDKKPFIEALKAKDFMSQVEKVIAESMGFSNINSHSFAHGRSWTYLQEGASGFQTKTGQMALQRQDVQVEIGRILKCDSKLLPEFLLGTIRQWRAVFQTKIIETLNATVEETGNIIELKAGELPADAFLEMVKRTPGSLGPNDEYINPTLMLNSNTLILLRHDIESRGESFSQQIEEAKKENEALVRGREKERLEKFGD